MDGAAQIRFTFAGHEMAVSSVTTDSRTVIPGSLFVPLVGTRQDGHEYIRDALKNGASVVLVNRTEYMKNAQIYAAVSQKRPRPVFIPVPDTLTALQDAARCHAGQFSSLVRIGITGSNGKTTTKEIVKALLSVKFRVIANEGNLNSETGLPLSLFNIRAEHQVGVFELGMNKPGEIAALAAVLRPKIALITNISSSHIEFFGSRERIAAEKKQIFSYAIPSCTAFIPAGDAFADFLPPNTGWAIIRYGDLAKAGISRVKNEGLSGTGFDYEGLPVLFPLLGAHNLRNAVAAISIARHLGLTPEEVRAGLESVRPLFGRSQIVRGDVTILQDCYNANPESMAVALDFFRDLAAPGRKALVLGDMLELGDASPAAHQQVVSAALETGALVVLIGPGMCGAYGVAKKIGNGEGRVALFAGTEDGDMERAGEALKKKLKKGDVVLIKGSRGIRMERITAILEAAHV
ncbi:MAG: UDP-N-acetylmuramoyl-tripeptide--D-alanyl-D-alanine ligase [Spirochaetaceae bacterium]|jgi:UDP-N-acetylmuramoyl-tripeptide--D-alanyl-D-alanine ligase|nr:UDP-N-acetylmuramoyl-tripeptide--D-alanyl-D-alanine ligase [Spirochaetaceae bacterium]